MNRCDGENRCDWGSVRARAAGYAGDGRCDLAGRCIWAGEYARAGVLVWADGCAWDSGRRERDQKAEGKAKIPSQNSRNYISSGSPTSDDLFEPPLRQVPSILKN